jgi:hypothetical protein
MDKMKEIENAKLLQEEWLKKNKVKQYKQEDVAVKPYSGGLEPIPVQLKKKAYGGYDGVEIIQDIGIKDYG